MKSRSLVFGTAVALIAATLAGCAEQGGKNANVDDARLVEGSPDGADWLSYGRTMDEQRFSPLTQVTDQNVNQLGLEWSSDLDTARGQEATPIVVDGIMYISTAWSMVKAYDAATGKKLWEYDPKVPRAKLVDVCCDAVNRGVAVYDDKVYLGTLDAKLVARHQAHDLAGGHRVERAVVPVSRLVGVAVDDLVEVEGEPTAIEAAILVLALPRETFTTGRLPGTSQYTAPGWCGFSP